MTFSSHVRRRRHAFWRRSVNAGGVCYPFFTATSALGVSCAIETAGDAPTSKLLPLAKLCDEVLFDLKIMDVTQARDVVKMNLPRVLENLRLLVSEGVNVIPRLPLILVSHSAGRICSRRWMY